MRRSAAVAFVGALLALPVSCETVDLGTPPADINACRPSQQFFIDQIWPNVLAKDYGGKHCYDGSCHGTGSGRPLTLILPTGAGSIPLMMEWATNYRSASEQMNCSNVKASDLITLPAGLRTHGGQKLFEPEGPESLLIQMWPAVQP